MLEIFCATIGINDQVETSQTAITDDITHQVLDEPYPGVPGQVLTSLSGY